MNETNTGVNEPIADNHPMMYEILWQYLVEIFNFFKYIFYDIYLGKDAF